MPGKNKEDLLGYTPREAARIFGKCGLKQEGMFPIRWKISVDHLPIEIFDIQGVRKTPMHLIKVMEHVDWCGATSEDVDPDEHTTRYILKYTLNVSAAFYRNDRFAYPLDVEQSTDYIRRTSCMSSVELRERGQARPLASSNYLSINIDSETKQPKPYPEIWKQKYNIPTTGPKVDFSLPVKPSTNVFSEQNTVRFTDVDENNHTNYVSYIRMCLDALYENVFHGKYSNNSKVFLNGWLKRLTIFFKADSILGDILTVDSWEDEQQRDTFHFELFNGGTLAVAVTMQFYTSLVENSRL